MGYRYLRIGNSVAKILELVLDVRASHGEGPVWDARQACVYFVDIIGRAVHQFHPESGGHQKIAIEDEPGCVAVRKDGGLVAALRCSFAYLNPILGNTTLLVDPEADVPKNRFNDGKCGPEGRFWAGTCSETCDVQGAGTLYRLDSDGTVLRMLRVMKTDSR